MNSELMHITNSLINDILLGILKIVAIQDPSNWSINNFTIFTYFLNKMEIERFNKT